MVNLELSSGSLNNLLLHGTFRYQSIDDHLFLLTDSVCSINSLKVNLRIPVRIKNDDYVCLVQVNPEAASPSGQDENLFV